MNEFELPTLAFGITLLMGFISTYAISFLNGVLPFVKEDWHKQVVTVIVSLAVAGLSIWLYYAISKEPLPEWPIFLLIGLMATSASYGLVTKKAGAKFIERKFSGSEENPAGL